MALLEQAAGQGHAYAMYAVGGIHHTRMEHEDAVKWFTKGAEAGLPDAMCFLGCCLDKGEGVAAADSWAAANWYMRAADAGDGHGAKCLADLYIFGRGRAWQIVPATSFSTRQTLGS